MKKVIIAFITLLTVTGCVKKHSDDAQTIYDRMNKDLESLYSDSSTTEEEIAIAEEEFIKQSIQLAKDNRETPIVYQIIKDLYYVLSTEEKEIVFACTNPDSLESYKLSGKYKALQMEKNTCAGKHYTDFRGNTPTGETLSVSDVLSSGKYVIIDFWASWCRPCREFMPELKELYENCSDKLDVLGVSLDTDYDTWLGAIGQLGLPWHQISDLKGWNCEYAHTYGVCAIPALVLISPDGTIIARNVEDTDKIREMIGE